MDAKDGRPNDQGMLTPPHKSRAHRDDGGGVCWPPQHELSMHPFALSLLQGRCRVLHRDIFVPG